MKCKPNQCPQCGGAAYEFPLETEYDPIAPEYFDETLQCHKCGHIWIEHYQKVYIGYKSGAIEYDRFGDSEDF